MILDRKEGEHQGGTALEGGGEMKTKPWTVSNTESCRAQKGLWRPVFLSLCSEQMCVPLWSPVFINKNIIAMYQAIVTRQWLP